MPLSLPAPAELERRARVIVFLDMLLEPEFALRSFDYDPAFARGQRLFSMRSGEGDHAFVWFGPGGTLARGKHRAKKVVAEAELFKGLPPSHQPAKVEPAFQLGGDSFATWAPRAKFAWKSARDPQHGGMGELLEVLDGDPKTFARYARGHHEVKLDLAALRSLYQANAVTPELVARLSGTIDASRAFAVAKELGLPLRGKVSAWQKGAGEPRETSDPLGDAEFKVVRSGDTTMLVVGGKVRLEATRQGLYYEVIEQVRVALRAAGAR